MKTLLKAIPGLLVIAVAIALLLGGAWLVANWFSGLRPETQTPVAALTGVVLAPLIAFGTSRYLERRRLLETSIRDRKTALYDEMIKGLMSMLSLGGSTKKIKNNPVELMRFFADITPRLITYGSRDVIRAWNRFRVGAAGSNPIEVMVKFENVLTAMRKDLGHGTVMQPKGELLGLFINDLHKIDFKTMAYKSEYATEADEDERS